MQALDLNARTKRLNEANLRLRRFVEAEQRLGNPWFLSSFRRSSLAEVAKSCPDYIDQWLQEIFLAKASAKALLTRCCGFYEALCGVLLNLRPEQGVKLFRLLRSDNTFRSSDRTTGIDSLLFFLFEAEDSEKVVQLRRWLIEKCTTDKCLFEFAFIAQLHGKHDELLEIADELLLSQHTFDLARGLMLLGFIDTQDANKKLTKWIATKRKSWIRGCAEVAQRIYNRNKWARHWFRSFLDREETVRAWAAFRLFLHCVDRRFWLWGPEMLKSESVIPERLEHYHANISQVSKAAIKNEKDVLKLEKKLFHSDIKEDQVWPWMSKYLESSTETSEFS